MDMLRIAALFALYAAGVHLFAGQRRVVAPLEGAAAVAPFARSTLFVVWHMASFVLVSTAAILAWRGDAIDPAMRALLAAQVGFAAGLFLLRGQHSHGGGFPLPQWILLGPLALAIAAPRFAAPIVLLALAAMHVAWVFGVAWPSPSVRTAPTFVIGWRESARLPPARPTLTVAVVLVAMAWAVLAGPRWAALATAVVLGLRGLFGPFERRVRPSIVGTPYRLLSAAFYSPLLLFVAALIAHARWDR